MGHTVRTVGSPAAPNDRGFPPTAWHQIDWRTAERRVQSLRFRIFRAAKEQRWKQVRHLTKLALSRSRRKIYGKRQSGPVRTTLS
jgi:hypothetical protein